MRALLVLLPLLLVAPHAAAQAHEHGSGGATAFVLFDGPPDGRAVVGGLTHFGFALVGEGGRPVVHRNAEFEVLQDNVTLFRSAHTHEYDGLFSFDVRFFAPGPYRVVARSEEMREGVFEGVAVEPVYETTATVTWEPEAAGASNQVAGTLSVVDAQGVLIPHSDAIVEIRRALDLRLESRFHLHVHEEPMTFRLALAPGDHVMRVYAYRAFPDGEDPDVAAVYAEFPVRTLAAPTPAVPAVPMPPAPLEPAGESAEADGYALHAMYDPYNQVVVGAPFRLAALAMGPGHTPLAHVDFSLVVNGPAGEVFRSESLHEYDGVLEWAYAPTLPGLYDATLTGDLNGTTLAVPFRFQALPPAAPLGAGPNTLTIDGLDGIVAGVPASLTFTITGASGPLAHSEIDVTILRPGEAPYQQFKLHTHDDGAFLADVTFPEDGDWLLLVDGFPLLPQAAVVNGPAGPGQPVLFTASVAPADGASGPAGNDGAARAETPLHGIAVGLLALAGAARLRRRG